MCPCQADEQLEKDFGNGLRLRPTIITLGQVTADDMKIVVGDFVEELSDSMGCPTFNTAITDLYGAMCCDIGTAFYFSLVPWIGIVWSMCACGCTGALLGSKRFPKRPWGAHYKADVEKHENQKMGTDPLNYEQGIMMDGAHNRATVVPHPAYEEPRQPASPKKGKFEYV